MAKKQDGARTEGQGPHLTRLCRSLRRRADAFDLPFERDAAGPEDPAPHFLAQRFKVGSGRSAEIDEKVAVHGRDLRLAEAQAAATRSVDQLPRLQSNRILEG